MTQEDHAIELAQQGGVLRAATAREHGIAGAVLSRLVKKGRLIRLSRGIYSLTDGEITEHHDLAEIASLVPDGVVCLISALGFHDLTTQVPHEVWLAIRAHSHRPRADHIPLRIVEMSGAAFEHGIETHRIEGVDVQVTSAAKTVADCFRFRNAVGLDVAIEALQDYVRRRQSIGALYEAAKASRVSTVIQPYLEATV